MPTPNHPKLPLCSQFAAQPERGTFAFWLNALLEDQSRDIRQRDALRLKGMLAAYQELGVISEQQGNAMSEELTPFAFGASA